jgi:hypothetical protein
VFATSSYVCCKKNGTLTLSVWLQSLIKKLGVTSLVFAWCGCNFVKNTRWLQNIPWPLMCCDCKKKTQLQK